jgi:type IV secretory pathway VirJ component
MFRNICSCILVLFAFFPARASDDFPIKEWVSSTHDKPFIFYISGDGGFNSFSTGLCSTLNAQGYDVVALNARSYFWDKKTPEETTTAITNFLTSKFTGRKNQQLILVGYSFGADVLPFIINKLSGVMASKLGTTFLLSPSTSTDFEIHWSDLMGFNKKRSMDVPAEINKLATHKIVIVSGSDEDEFPFDAIKLKKYFHTILPGGHHFDGNTKEVVNTITRNM